MNEIVEKCKSESMEALWHIDDIVERGGENLVGVLLLWTAKAIVWALMAILAEVHLIRERMN